MGLEIIDLVRRHAGQFTGALHQLDLRGGVGHGQAGLVAIGIDHRGGDDGEDAVAIGECLIEILEQEDAAALGARVAIARLIEDLTAAGLREHGGLGEDQEAVRVQVQADAAGQRHVGLAAADRLAGLMEGDQRRGTGGVQRQARPMQVKGIGQAIGGHAGGVAGGGIRTDGAQVIRHAIGIVETRHAHEDATARAAHLLGGNAGVLDGLPAHLQQHALLGVHVGGFAWADAEERRVKARDVAQRAGGEAVAHPRCLLVRVQEGVLAPAVIGDFGHHVLAGQEVVPQSGLSGAGETAGSADDGNASGHERLLNF